MVHLGDICQINGAEIEPVDVITGGSPCQDLSIAGNRKGLAGERSGLFMEQIRIIKEMREADKKRGRSGEFVRCRYAVWENVGGSFSSNKGRDFQAVLTEFVRVAEPYAPDVPMPDKGKWPKSGWLYDELGGWSVAWRIHDAQFWGVPQRRKRIALVADFNGLTAPEILFDPQYRREAERAESNETEQDSGDGSGPEVQTQCESVSRDSEPGGTPGEGTAQGVEGSVGGADQGSGNCRTGRTGGAISFQERAGKPRGARESLSRVSGQEPCQRLITNPFCKNPWDPQSARVYGDDSTWHSLNANENGGQSRDAVLTSVAVRLDNTSAPPIGGIEVSPTIRQGAWPNGCANVATYSIQGNTIDRDAKQNGSGVAQDVSHTLNSTDRHGVATTKAYSFDSLSSNSMKSSNPHSGCREVDVSKTLDCFDPNPSKNQGGIAVLSVDCRNGTENENTNVTLQAKANGGQSLNCGIVIREKK